MRRTLLHKTLRSRVCVRNYAEVVCYDNERWSFRLFAFPFWKIEYQLWVHVILCQKHMLSYVCLTGLVRYWVRCTSPQVIGCGSDVMRMTCWNIHLLCWFLSKAHTSWATVTECCMLAFSSPLNSLPSATSCVSFGRKGVAFRRYGRQA